MDEEKELEVEKKENVEELKNVSENKKSKKIKVLIISVITLFVSFLIFVVGAFILFGDEISNGRIKENSITDVHRFTGDILFSKRVGDYSFVTEYFKKDGDVGDINVNFLHKNKLVSNILVAENIDITNCSDYSIMFKDYNNDGMSDFSHIFSFKDGSSGYKIYTLTKEGKLILLTEDEYEFASNKFSLVLDVIDGKYVYNKPKIYYDGYEIGTDAGYYDLGDKKNNEYKTVNSESKISFSDNRVIEKGNYNVSNLLDDKFLKNNSLLKRYKDVIVMDIDFDNNGELEKVIYLFDNNTNDTRIIVLDSNEEVIANLINTKGVKYELDEVVEFYDIDSDGIIEIITKLNDENKVCVSKYNNGYYFPEIKL